jgi:hypothetical protein
MGCKTSICADSNELLLSQHLQDKEIDITLPVSEKSTNNSLNTILTRNHSRSFDPAKPAFLLKSFCVLMLKSFENSEELISIGDLWITEIFRALEESVSLPEDLRTSVSLDSSGNCIVIKHEVDGIRNYEKVAWFGQKLQNLVKSGKKQKFSYEHFAKAEEFLLGLCPLTISMYLKLGNEVDCGIGIEKPLDRKQMSQFLSLTSEAKNIAVWANTNGQPIPVSCSFSALSLKQSINFYIFDGMKEQNFSRALSAFYHFGAPVPTNLQEIMQERKGEEINCVIEFNKSAVSGISMIMQTQEASLEMLRDLETGVDEKKWQQFQNFFTVKFVSLDLSPEGFSIKEYSST